MGTENGEEHLKKNTLYRTTGEVNTANIGKSVGMRSEATDLSTLIVSRTGIRQFFDDPL